MTFSAEREFSHLMGHIDHALGSSRTMAVKNVMAPFGGADKVWTQENSLNSINSIATIAPSTLSNSASVSEPAAAVVAFVENTALNEPNEKDKDRDKEDITRPGADINNNNNNKNNNNNEEKDRDIDRDKDKEEKQKEISLDLDDDDESLLGGWVRD